LKLVACPNGPKNCPHHHQAEGNTLPLHDNETLPIINKPKHPKKGEYKEQNGRTHVQEDKKNQLRDRTTRGTSSSLACFVLVLHPSFI